METIWTTIKYLIIKSWKIFTYFFALETPKSRIFTISISSLILIILPLNKLSLLPIFSVYEKMGLYNFLGFEFYSVGMTRSLSSIFHLNFLEAWQYNPLGFIFVFGLIIMVSTDSYKIYKNKETNKEKLN